MHLYMLCPKLRIYVSTQCKTESIVIESMSEEEPPAKKARIEDEAGEEESCSSSHGTASAEATELQAADRVRTPTLAVQETDGEQVCRNHMQRCGTCMPAGRSH